MMMSKRNFFLTGIKSKKIILALSSCLLIFLIFSLLYVFHVTDGLEFKTADYRRMVLTKYDIKKEIPSDIVYVNLDEESLAFVRKTWNSRYPWPTIFYSKMLDYISKGGAKAVLFDFLWDYPSTDLDNEPFANSITNAGNTIFGCLFDRIPSNRAPTSDDIKRFSLNLKTDGSVSIEKTSRPLVLPFETIYQSTGSIGDVYFFSDSKNLNQTRKNQLIVEYDGNYYPTLALAGYLMAKGTRDVEVLKGKFYIGSGSDRVSIPVDKNGFMWIKYYGPSKSYRNYSIANVINSGVADEEIAEGKDSKDNISVDKTVFKDKIVIVCGTAMGLKDLRPNPFSDNDPGGHFHGSTIDTLMKRDFIVDLYGLQYVLPILFLLCLIGILTGTFISPKRNIPVIVLVLAGFITTSFLLYKANILIEMADSLFTLAISYLAGMLINFIFEIQQKSFIQGAFSQFLAPAVLQKLLKDPSKILVKGEEKELSIFFSDLEGFTTISEKLTPVNLVNALNKYLTAMTNIIVSEQNGYVDKYEGDAIMAFWGAPVDEKDHALKACYSALDNQKRLSEIRNEFAEFGLAEGLKVRIGINTGEVVVGMIGSEKKLNYTVIGDAVNLASRLEGANKEYKTNIMISDKTYALVKDHFIIRELDLLRVKGKLEPTKVYELISRKGELDDKEAEYIGIYLEGLSLYKQKKWDDAAVKFNKVLELKKDDGPSKLYIDRCVKFKSNPPPGNWDGVFVMTSK
jgi:adenylate cyclase